jgi:hypothetical protein
MDFITPTNIEEIIISDLSHSSRTGEALLKSAQQYKKGFTKQALYLVLRRLMEKEVVVKHGKTFSLSQLWIVRMNEFFVVAGKQYGVDDRNGNDFLALSEGDKIQYGFKNPVEADKFWAHAFNILGTLVNQKEPLCFYNPHEWFFLARKESEGFLFLELKKKEQKVWMIVGGTSTLDKHSAQYFDGKILQYYMAKEVLFEARNYYLNIFGDYILEARIDEKVAEKVDEFYEMHTNVTDETTKLLTSLLTQGKTTITITRSKKKADKLKKVFKPYFY